LLETLTDDQVKLAFCVGAFLFAQDGLNDVAASVRC
jgi:hypothetical protein